jgi:large subunit ribosomal protein LP1
MHPNLSAAQKEEVAVTYASLILHDDGAAVTAEKLNAILEAANIKVQPFLPKFFARVLEKQNIEDFLAAGASGGSGGAAPAAAPVAEAASAPKEAAPAKEEKKEEKKVEEEEDEDMGFGLFD